MLSYLIDKPFSVMLICADTTHQHTLTEERLDFLELKFWLYVSFQCTGIYPCVELGSKNEKQIQVSYILQVCRSLINLTRAVQCMFSNEKSKSFQCPRAALDPSQLGLTSFVRLCSAESAKMGQKYLVPPALNQILDPPLSCQSISTDHQPNGQLVTSLW